MPELPEVETVRRSLERVILGATVERVALHRPDVVTGDASPEGLLAGGRIASLARHGKHMAIVADDGRALEVHLGMSGAVTCAPARGGADLGPWEAAEHVHAAWLVRTPGGGLLSMRFRDPRRFGGLWTFASEEALRARRWSRLGPDALSIDARDLAARLKNTRRTLKAALLDQTLIAGIGNIYADESMFAAGLSPVRLSHRLRHEEVARLREAMVAILGRAVAAGGSTLRDGGYADSAGAAGAFQVDHAVYGRRGQPCRRCAGRLRSAMVGGRTTVWCSRCQSAARRARSKR